MNFYKDKEIRYHHRHFITKVGTTIIRIPLMITTCG